MSIKGRLDAETHFFELEELADLSLTDLQALWDSVSSEDQTYLVRVFEREANKRQIVEDIDESRMARYFLEQYRQTAFVPAGDVWVKVPLAVRDQYKQPLTDDTATDDSDDSLEEGETRKSVKKRAFPRWIVLLVIPFGCLLIFAFMRVASGGTNNRPRRQPTPTITPSPTPTATPTSTPTPLPPTATPFALSGFDQAITAGDRSSREYYPVQLQIFPTRDTAPRVFIVQQQAVNVAEWTFDPNPDVVSWLRGMIVRPVLGVPFSASNLDLFRGLNASSIFVVTMNTGDIWQFVYQDTQRVGRSDTTLFQQDAPGLALVLIGETFADGSPTDLRTVVRATYPTDQEMGGLSHHVPAVIPMQTAHQMDGMTLTVQAARLVASDALPPELAYAVIDLQILSGESDIATGGLTWLLELMAAPGERYAREGTSEGDTCAPLTDRLPANTAVCASIRFLVSRSADDTRLWVGMRPDDLTAFQVTLDPLPDIVSSSQIDVQLGRITYTDRTLTVTARLFNPTTVALPLTAQDFGLVLGFVPNPTGATLVPQFPSQSLASNAALDITLEYPYAGEGYAVLILLGRTWAVQVKR